MRHVAIIGGGISGLACAIDLARDPDLAVQVIEASGRLGGTIHTERRRDGIIEAGPDGAASWRPEFVALARDLGVPLVNAAPGVTSVLHRGRTVPIPAGLVGAVPTALWPTLRSPLLTPLAKVRLLTEPLRRRGSGGEETAAGFVRRRVGGQFWDRIGEPLVGAMYAADGERLAASAALPRLVEAERRHGSITRAALRARRAGRGGRTGPGPPPVATTPDGMGALIEAMADDLARRARIRTGCGATTLASRAGGWTVGTPEESIAADAVVLAVPAPLAGDLIDGLDPALAADLRAVEFAAVAVVGFVVPATAAAVAGYGHIVPRRTGSPVVSVSVTTAKFPDLAVDDHAVIRVLLGRHGDATDRMDEGAMVDAAREHLRATLGIDAQPSLVHRVRYAVPQYVVGHRDRVARIVARTARHAGLFLTGASYGGVGLPDCIAHARATAAQVRAAVSRAPDGPGPPAPR